MGGIPFGEPDFAVRGEVKRMPAEIGDVAPDFKLPSVNEGDITLS